MDFKEAVQIVLSVGDLIMAHPLLHRGSLLGRSERFPGQ